MKKVSVTIRIIITTIIMVVVSSCDLLQKDQRYSVSLIFNNESNISFDVKLSIVEHGTGSACRSRIVENRMTVKPGLTEKFNTIDLICGGYFPSGQLVLKSLNPINSEVYTFTLSGLYNDDDLIFRDDLYLLGSFKVNDGPLQTTQRLKLNKPLDLIHFSEIPNTISVKHDNTRQETNIFILANNIKGDLQITSIEQDKILKGPWRKDQSDIDVEYYLDFEKNTDIRITLHCSEMECVAYDFSQMKRSTISNL